MMYTRYRGSFLGINGTVWTVVILQENDSLFPVVGTLDFPGDTPLEIQWEKTAKEDAVCGSVATLTVVSPEDRTYEDLYSVEPGMIRMDVYKDDVLYWSGCLDPEFYEEPYSREKNYDVKFTFSDFGILDRLKYDFVGMQPLSAILTDAMRRSKVNYGSINQSLISTFIDDVQLTLDALQVRSDNFFDEDGEAATMREVLDGILQPLALRMVQRCGNIYIYDLNSLHGTEAGKLIEWACDDQQMGVDKVVNNVKVTFSQYSGVELSQEIECDAEVSEDKENFSSSAKADGEYYSFAPKHRTGSRYETEGAYQDPNNVSFTVFLSDTGSGLSYKHPDTKYFHIFPVLGGQEATGLMHWMYAGCMSLESGKNKRVPASVLPAHTELMRTNRFFLPKIKMERNPRTEALSSDYLLRVAIEMVCDPRYNFHEDKSGTNEVANYDTIKEKSKKVSIPVQIRLYDTEGNVIYHYINRAARSRNDRDNVRWYTRYGSWAEGDYGSDDWDASLFEWYDPSDKENSGILGWKTNRQVLSGNTTWIPPSYAKVDPGQYLTYPPEGGWVEICILSDVLFGSDLLDQSSSGLIRWMLFKAPVVDLVKANSAKNAIENEDIEYCGEVNAAAKEGLDIGTICGTSVSPNPAAKGLFFRSSDGLALESLTRADRTTQAEELLIGTLYSQYAARKTTLSGTAFLTSDAVAWYHDAAQPGKKFLLVSDIQKLRENESVIEVIEFNPDEYKSDKE